MGQLPRNKILLFAAVLGLTAALLAYVFLQRQRAQAQMSVMAVVARADIPVGTIISEQMVQSVSKMRNQLPSGTYISREAVLGKVAEVDVKAGDPLTTTNVSQKYRLSHLVKPYMRAVTVACDDIVGVAGFLKPGDKVDVISTFRVNDGTLTKTVLQNVELIAIGKEVIDDDTSEPSRHGDRAQAKTQTTATLAVMPFDAEKLIFADARGKIRLALRRPDDASFIAVKGVNGRQVMGLVPSDEPQKQRTVSDRDYEPAPSRQMMMAPPIIPQPVVQPAQTVPATTAADKSSEQEGKTIQVVRGTKVEDVDVPE